MTVAFRSTRGQSRRRPLDPRRAGLLAAVFLIVSAAAVAAKELRITLATEPTSIDPHASLSTPNLGFAQHIFDRLVHTDERHRLIPGLALSWRAVDDLTWEFKLRPGVTFHDGAPLTADDVIFSLARAAAAPGAPPGFGLNFRGRSAVRVDDVTVRVATAEPYPLLPNDMTAIPIVSKNRVAGAAAADFASGKAAIGTGPYKFAARAPGDRIQLVANPDYWGAKPAWSTVTFRANKAGPARVAALLAGETDVIEDVPSADIARLKSEAKVALAQSTSYRVVFLQMDQWRDTTPFANAKDGSAIKNPFKNPKVRRAIATVINREAICARVMDGNATVAGQFLPDGFFGVSPNVKPIQYDPEKAKRLLTEAGFPNGFKVTLHGPAGRYPNDTKIIEAVAQMLSRIGIEATIETMPPTQFFTRATSGADGEPEFSLFLAGWAASSGENSSPLKGLVATHNKETSFGLSNRGRYSNKAVDDALDTALRTLDNALLNAGLARATELALADTALIPILHPLNTWGVRRGLAYRARADEATTAMMVREEQAP